MVLVASAAAISAAFVLAPGSLAAGPRPGYAGRDDLVDTVAAAFVDYWSSGARQLSPIMANDQGAMAPLSSLISMVPLNDADPVLSGTLTHVRRYHLTMAVIALVASATSVGVSVLACRRYAGTSRSYRRSRLMLVSVAGTAALFALLLSLVGVANALTAADPAPALLAFFDGGF